MRKQQPTDAQPVPPAVSPAPELLPLCSNEISWSRFEAFCRELISRQPGIVRCYHYGKQGSKQYGIDLIAEREDGKTWVYQCKQNRTFSVSQTRAAIAKATYKADKYHILVACELGSEVRNACSAAGWVAWDVRDISLEVRQLEMYQARRIVDSHFGAAWTKAFLGIDWQTPFLTTSEFFEVWSDSTRLFNHSWKLVGRGHLLDQLASFVADPNLGVAILPGRGGIGKSKVLRAFAEHRVEADPGRPVFFADLTRQVTPATLTDLPNSECLVIVDDAHRYHESMKTLLAHVARQTTPTRLILSTRPHAVDALRATLRESGFHYGSIRTLEEMRQLSIAEVVELAQESLGPEYAHHAASLARITRDCLLITVVAGRLIATRELSPQLLAADDEFRYEVLSKFEDVETGKLGRILTQEACRDLLRVVSALSPLPVDNAEIIEAVAEFIVMPRHKVREALGELVTAGALIWHAGNLRITPDVLSDHILFTACVSRNGMLTGYGRHVFEKFWELSPSAVLKNLAELDWRQHHSNGRDGDILGDLWPTIERQFIAACNAERCIMLDGFGEVAVLQPARILALVNTAIGSPSLTPDDERMTMGIRLTHDDVLRHLPKVLGRIALTPDFFSLACDVLWKLGRDDTLTASLFQEHGIKVLQDLIKYQPQKPMWVYERAVEAVERWLHEPDALNHVASPLDILDAILAKEGHTAELQGRSFVMAPFLVASNATRAFRDHALNLIESVARSANVCVVLRAIASLEIALSQPQGLFGSIIPEAALLEWVPEQLQVLSILQDIAKRPSDPLIAIRAAEAVHWHALYGHSAVVRRKATSVARSISSDFPTRLTQALTRTRELGDMPTRGEELAEFNARREAEKERKYSDLAIEFMGKYANAADGAQCLRARMAEIRESGVDLVEWPFIPILARNDVQYSANMSADIIANPDDQLTSYLGWFLAAVRQSDTTAAVALVRAAVASFDPRLCRAAAKYCQYDWSESTFSDQVDVLRSLATSTDLATRSSVLAAARELRLYNSNAAVEITQLVEIGKETQLAKDLCYFFYTWLETPGENVPNRQLDAAISKLLSVDDIGEHFVNAFLQKAAHRRPRQVVNLLLDRIKRGEDIDEKVYRPLPRQFHQPLNTLSQTSEYGYVLRQIRDSSIGASYETIEHLTRLFKEASCSYSDSSLVVLTEWANSGETEKVLLAARLASEAPTDFVFTRVDLALLLIKRAHEIDDTCGRRVVGYLSQTALRTSYMVTPGSPAPGHVSLREAAGQMTNSLLAGTPEHTFYKRLAQHADEVIKHQQAVDEEFDND